MKLIKKGANLHVDNGCLFGAGTGAMCLAARAAAFAARPAGAFGTSLAPALARTGIRRVGIRERRVGERRTRL